MEYTMRGTAPFPGIRAFIAMQEELICRRLAAGKVSRGFLFRGED
jgi:hypothetical protein